MAEGVCALTGETGKYIKSHLYPAAFYKRPDDGKHFAVIGGNLDHPPKRSWTGLYDSTLVTASGESILADLDDYAARTLLPYTRHSDFWKKASRKYVSGENVHAAEFADFDTSRLLRFFYSILWRFAASTRPETKRVTLGPHLEPLRELVLSENFEQPKEFGVSLLRLIDEVEVPVQVPAAYRDEASSVNMFRMVLGGYQANFRADKRKLRSPFPELEMAVGKPPIIMAYRFSESRSYLKLARMVRKSSYIYGSPWGGESKG